MESLLMAQTSEGIKEKNKTVLIVDDAKSILGILNAVLGQHYHVELKSNGREALAWLQEGNLPDVIVTDIKMPEMDGFDFIKHIKASGFFKDIPLIVLSSVDATKERIKCLKAGADDFLVKPFNPEELDARIHNIIKRTQ